MAGDRRSHPLFNVELDVRSVFAAGIRFVVRFFMIAEDAGEDAVRESFYFQVVGVDGGVEIPSGHIDTVLGTLDICLKILEGLGGLQIGIGFSNRHQPAE